MRRALVVAVSLVTTAGALLLAAGADAAGVAATGWWSRNPVASAPEGGMAVGFMPDGPATVAAVKVDLGDGVTSAMLELTEAGGTATDAASVLACETSTMWTPVEKGPIEKAPTTACAAGHSVVLARDADSLTWSADLSALLRGRTGPASVALVPGEVTEGLGSVVFEVQWSGPPVFTSTSKATARSTSPTTGSRSATTAPPSRPSSATAAQRPASELVTAPPPVSAPAVVAPTAESPSTSVPETSPMTSALPQASGPGVPADAPWQQLIFFLVVAAGAGALAGTGRWFVSRR